MGYFTHMGRKDNCCEDCKAEGPCEPCNPIVCSDADTLSIVISGIMPCSCVDIGSGLYRTTTLTGINGMFTVTWDGVQWYLATGSFTAKVYNDPDCTEPPISSISGALEIIVDCEDGTGYRALVNASSPGDVLETDRGDLGDILANTATCSSGYGEGGTATIDL